MTHAMRISILIVDDDEPAGRRMRQTLEEAGFDATSFTDAPAALVHAARVPPHLMLVDLALPEVDGVAAVAALRGAAPTARCVAMLAFPTVDELLAAFRGGAADVLIKPVQPPSLVAFVEAQLASAGVLARDEAALNVALGGRLRRLRQQRELTLQAVADASGITAAQLSQIELGKTATTTWTLARVCAALRTPIGRVFEEPAP